MTFTQMRLCFRPDEFKFGCTSLRVPPELLYQLRNDITVSPNGIAFVKVQHPLTPSALMRFHLALNVVLEEHSARARILSLSPPETQLY